MSITTLDEQGCDSCRFWQQLNTKHGDGLCRRYAPKPIIETQSLKGGESAQWLRTFLDDWCGEWQAK